MFIDPARNPKFRAPGERNVCGAEYARSTTFRSSGAGTVFLELAFHQHSVPAGRVATWILDIWTKQTQ